MGEPEKNLFLENVYQGSTGKVYPYPTIEKITDNKIDKEYTAVFLENEYLKVMILPELGGRIQRAYDKLITMILFTITCNQTSPGWPVRSMDFWRNRI